MDLAYFSRRAFFLPATACPKVAEYSKEKPPLVKVSRRFSHAPSVALEPLCPSSTKTRLLPAKASTATVFSPDLSPSLLMSMTSTLMPKLLASKSKEGWCDVLFLSNRAAPKPDKAKSATCCLLKPSRGVKTIILSGFLSAYSKYCRILTCINSVLPLPVAFQKAVIFKSSA